MEWRTFVVVILKLALVLGSGIATDWEVSSSGTKYCYARIVLVNDEKGKSLVTFHATLDGRQAAILGSLFRASFDVITVPRLQEIRFVELI